MKTRHFLMVWLASAALALPAAAQDETPEPAAGDGRPEAGEAAGDAAGEAAGDAAGAAAGDAAGAAAEDSAGDAGDAGEAADGDGDAGAEAAEEREFIFSEEIPADQQVTFPVDI
jgi:hypothetical protein